MFGYIRKIYEMMGSDWFAALCVIVGVVLIVGFILIIEIALKGVQREDFD